VEFEDCVDVEERNWAVEPFDLETLWKDESRVFSIKTFAI
jgi:hypothetical protein